jgi:ABC-2 type transport system ATP-binding protein
MIEVTGLRKRFGNKVAVDDLSFVVQPGRVTGFLGPNGSGKSTTMRCMIGLDRAENGVARFRGQAYTGFKRPLTEVGVLLDAGYVHPGRTARNHLRWIAASNGLASSRVGEVLDLVGLTDVAGQKVKGFSLGMKQRLGLASALLGDPHTIILDEPANGLDPEGIRWIRAVLVHLAGQGRTVFVSSHLLGEMATMADDLVVIGQGRLIEQSTVADFVERHSDRWVRVRSPQIAELTEALARAGHAVRPVDAGTADVLGTTSDVVGQMAAAHSVVLHELSPQTGSLEDAFLRATMSTVEYTGQVL